MTKIEKDRIVLKAAIVEQNLDMLDYEQMRGIYLATLQISLFWSGRERLIFPTYMATYSISPPKWGKCFRFKNSLVPPKWG